MVDRELGVFVGTSRLISEEFTLMSLVRKALHVQLGGQKQIELLPPWNRHYSAEGKNVFRHFKLTDFLNINKQRHL